MTRPLLPPPLAAVVRLRLARLTAVLLAIGLVAAAWLADGPPRRLTAAADSNVVRATAASGSVPKSAPRRHAEVEVSDAPLAPPTPVVLARRQAAPPTTMPAPLAPPRSSPSTTTPAAVWPVARAPVPGVYRYDGTAGGQPVPMTLTVADRSRSATATRQHEDLTSQGATHTADVAWTSTAKVIEVGDCAWAPALVFLHLPLSTGQTWHTDTSCQTGASDGSAATIARSEDVQVKGRATTALDGAPTRVWVIERHVVVTVRQGGSSATSEAQTTELFAPEVGLIVYETGKAAAPNADGSVSTSTWTMALRSAHPS